MFQWLAPFIRGEGLEAYDTGYGNPARKFLHEVQAELRVELDWRRGEEAAAQDLLTRMDQDDETFLKVLEFAVANPLLGYSFQEVSGQATALKGILNRAGSEWELVDVPGRTEYRLRRRVTDAAESAVQRGTKPATGASQHLDRAWTAAFARDPNPTQAYDEAVKAVEAVVLSVVIPNDAQGTLGKAIARLRDSPTKWSVDLSVGAKLRPSGSSGIEISSVEVIVALMDLLWRNQPRHAEAEPGTSRTVTPSQAESAVHIALLLVHVFRSGAVTPAVAGPP